MHKRLWACLALYQLSALDMVVNNRSSFYYGFTWIRLTEESIEFKNGVFVPKCITNMMFGLLNSFKLQRP